MTDTTSDVDFTRWLQRWDIQQQGYVPEREARFTAMFDVLDELLPPSFVALDLACGPGSLSQRLLARFPQAEVVAVDMDPMMLALGRGAVGDVDGRLRFVEANASAPDWVDALGRDRFDAVLSTTALHWLLPDALTRAYRQLAELLPAGGVLLNGDHLAYGPERPTLQKLNDAVFDRTSSDAAFAANGIETFAQWWEAFAAEPALAPLVPGHERVAAAGHHQDSPPDYDAHVAALVEAGFSEVGTVWQRLSDRVLVAVR